MTQIEREYLIAANDLLEYVSQMASDMTDQKKSEPDYDGVRDWWHLVKYGDRKAVYSACDMIFDESGDWSSGLPSELQNSPTWDRTIGADLIEGVLRAVKLLLKIPSDKLVYP